MKPKISIVILLFANLLCSAQNINWIYGSGGWVNDYANDVTSDKYGNVYTTGYWGSAFISRIAPDGSLVWIRIIDERNTAGIQIRTDSLGYVYCAGNYSTGFEIDGITIDNPTGDGLFIAKLNEDGNFIWIKTYGTDTRMSMLNDFEIGPDGNLFVGMNFEKTISLGDSVYSRASNYNSSMLIIKLSAEGDLIDVKNPGSISDDVIHDLAVDPNGNVYFTGYTLAQSLEFGDTSFINPKSCSGFLAKYSKDLNIEWFQFLEAPYYSKSFSLSIDSHHDVAVTGSWSEGNYDSLMNHFVAKFDPNGNQLFLHLINSRDSRYEYPGYSGGRTWDICTNDRDIYVTSSLKESVQMGNVDHHSDGNRQAVIIKYNEIGYAQWLVASDGNLEEKGYRIFNNGNNLFVCGNYNSDTIEFGENQLINNSGNSNTDFFVIQAEDTTSNVCPETGGHSILSDSIICEGDSILLTIEGEYTTYTEWFLNDTSLDQDNQKQITISKEGVYSVVINSDTRCPETWISRTVQYLHSEDTSDITIYPLPISLITGPDSVCMNDTLTLINIEAPNQNYLWLIPEVDYLSNSTSSFIEASWQIEIDSILVTSIVSNTISNCKKADSTYIHINALPSFALYWVLDSLKVYTDEALRYQWYFNYEELTELGSQEIIGIDSTGIYFVIAENENRCRKKSNEIMAETMKLSDINNELVVVYPNPTKSIINIKGRSTPEYIEIFDVSGVMKMRVENQEYVDLSQMTNGTYMLRCKYGDVLLKTIFIKQ